MMTFHISKSQGWLFPHGSLYCFKMLSVSIYWTTNGDKRSKLCHPFPSIPVQPAPPGPPLVSSATRALLLGAKVLTLNHASVALGNYQVPLQVIQPTLMELLLPTYTCRSVGTTGKVPTLSLLSSLPWTTSASQLPLPDPSLPPHPQGPSRPAVVKAIPDTRPTSSLKCWIPSPHSSGVIFLKRKSDYHTLSPVRNPSTPLTPPSPLPSLLQQTLNSWMGPCNRPSPPSPASPVTPRIFIDWFNYSTSSGGALSGSGAMLGAGDPAMRGQPSLQLPSVLATQTVLRGPAASASPGGSSGPSADLMMWFALQVTSRTCQRLRIPACVSWNFRAPSLPLPPPHACHQPRILSVLLSTWPPSILQFQPGFPAC